MFSSKTIFVFITLAAIVPYACGSRFRLDFDSDIESIREKLFIFTAHNTIRTPSLDRLHGLLDNFTRDLNSTITAYQDNFLYQKMIIFHETENFNLTTYRAQLAEFVASRKPNTTGSELVEENHEFEAKDTDYFLSFCEWLLAVWDYCDKAWFVVRPLLEYCIFHFLQFLFWVLRYVNEAWIELTGGCDNMLRYLRSVNWPKSFSDVLDYLPKLKYALPLPGSFQDVLDCLPRISFCLGKDVCYAVNFPLWSLLLLAYVAYWAGKACLHMWSAIPVFVKVIMVCMIIETLKLLFF